MALNKTPIPLNLLSGTDTKMNDQIDTGYKDMINVVFTGDQTAKKMKGYDVIASLPSSENYSGIFTRKDELLFQTEKGAYKYYENTDTVKKIDEVGSTEVRKLTSYGEQTCVSDDYIMHISISREGDIDVSNNVFVANYFNFTFTDKSGNVLNEIEVKCSIPSELMESPIVFRWVKSVQYQNAFIAMIFDENGKVLFKKYTVNVSTNEFEEAATIVYTGLAYAGIEGFDLYTDGSQVIWVMKHSSIATGGGIYRLNFSTLAQTHTTSVDALGDTPNTSLYIFNRNSTTFYVTYTNTTTTMLLTLAINNKADLSFVSSAIVTSRFYTAAIENLHFLPYVLSDTSVYAIAYSIRKADNTGVTSQSFSPFSYSTCYFQNGDVSNFLEDVQVSQGTMPISKIFIENGEYYFFAISQLGLSSIYHVLKASSGCQVATFCSSKTPQVNANSIIKNYNLYWRDPTDWFSYSINDAYKSSGKWFFTVRKCFDGVNYYPQSELYTVDFDASLVNNQLELDGKTSVFNGQPAYYDGSDFSEFGFNNRPLITNVRERIVTLNTIPSGDYQFCAIYKWLDSSGNVFYSDLSNITGPTTLSNPGNTLTLQFDLYFPLLTTKNDVQLLVFIKKDADQFRLLQTFAYKEGQIKDFVTPSVNGLVYPDSDNEFYLPFTSTFVAGGDYPTSPLTASISSSIYEDRIFSLSPDNPISLAYSQKKILGYGTEFNQDIFYLDIYDKRGVYEDELVGTIAMDGRQFIFKKRSILYIVGSGPSRANTGDDISTPQLVTTDVGCISAKSLVLTPSGIMFMSDKGIYLLDRKLQVSYIGSNVERFNSNTVTSAILLEKINEIRFTTLEGEVLVYNYFQSAWSWFTGIPAIGACFWKGQYVILKTNGKILLENQAHNKMVDGITSTAIIQTISTPWIRAKDIQNWEKIYQTLLLGFYKTDHTVKVSVYYDYELYVSEEYTIIPLSGSSYNTTVKPSNSDIESAVKTNGVYQMKIDMIRKNCQAFRIVITDTPIDVASNTGESFALSNITITIGSKKGVAKLPASKMY